MLGIFILVGIATTLARKAFDKDRNRYLWGAIGVVSYYLFQLVAGIFIAFIEPEWLQNQGIVLGLGLGFGFIGVGIAYYILHKLPNPTEVEDSENDLLDAPLS